MKTALLNTTILTNNGVFELRDISLEKAKSLIKQSDEVISTIGHQSTVDVLSSLLEYPVQANRINLIQDRDTACICFKLRG